MGNNDKVSKGRNVLRIKLQSRGKGEAEFDLLKLPIDVLYSEALREIGEQESYIEELAYTVKKLQTENAALKNKLELFEFLNAEERLIIENDENYLKRASSRKKLARENESLREDIANLIFKLSTCKNEINSLKEQLENNQQTN